MHWFHKGIKDYVNDDNLIVSKPKRCFGKKLFKIKEVKNMLIDLYPDSAVKIIISLVQGKTTIVYDINENVSYRVWTDDYNTNANDYIQVSVGFDDKFSIICKICNAEKTAFINANHLTIIHDKLTGYKSCF